MELPQDIEQRLERRWFARYGQEATIREQKPDLNESQVTDKKVEAHVLRTRVHAEWPHGRG
jgi:hypothetical protein